MASIVVSVSMSDEISSPEIAYPDSYRAISVAREADCMLMHDGTSKVCLLDEHLSAIMVYCRIMECRLDVEVAAEVVVHEVLELAAALACFLRQCTRRYLYASER
jgi:hypothetical protein